MARHRRQLLFATDPRRPGPAAEDIFPRPVESTAIRLLWLGLAVVLAVLAGILLLWSNGGI